jgi:hypothetical protein
MCTPLSVSVNFFPHSALFEGLEKISEQSVRRFPARKWLSD